MRVRIFFLLLMSVMFSCDSDVVSPAEGCDLFPAKYDTATSNEAKVKDIIDRTCAYSGCHDGAGGIGPGNYSTYEGILGILENGSFASRVITQRENPSVGMPPNNSVFAQSLQDDLSPNQLDIITCWLEEGFPE